MYWFTVYLMGMKKECVLVCRNSGIMKGSILRSHNVCVGNGLVIDHILLGLVRSLSMYTITSPSVSGV